jgi:hypothetical protein
MFGCVEEQNVLSSEQLVFRSIIFFSIMLSLFRSFDDFLNKNFQNFLDDIM